jgi:dolichol kinase
MVKARLVTEVQRKLFHSLMVLVAIVNWIGGPPLSIGFAGVCLAVFIVLDFLRIRVYGYFPFRRITDRVMRPKERTQLGANVFFAVGTLFTLLSLFILGALLYSSIQLFCYWMITGWLGVAAVIVAAIGDAAAAIVGMICGRHRLKGNRTIEGTVGGFIIGSISILPLWFFLGIPWVYGIIGAMMLVIVDMTDLPLNDNLLNPVVIGFSLSGVEIITVMLLGLGVT